MQREEALKLVADDTVREFKLTKDGDTMTTKILDDGSWRCDVEGSISAVNHGNADQFLAEAQRLVGGATEIEKHHGHAHAHAHEHAHAGHRH